MRKKLLTDTVLAQIPLWRRDGLGPAEMAARIGCTIGSLRVVCSRYGLSLRRRSTSATWRNPDRREDLIQSESADLVLRLPEETRLRLRARAEVLGLSELDFTALLLETIDRDDLYSAVLDDGGQRDRPDR